MQNRSVKQSAIALLIVAAMVLCSASVIFSDGSDAAISKATTDAAGNELKSEYDSSSIVTVGVGSLRWTAYFGKTSDVVCIDAGDANNASWNGKAYRSLFNFDQAGLVSKMTGAKCSPSESDLAEYGMAAHDHNSFSTDNLEEIAKWNNVPTLMIVSNSVYASMSDELKNGISRLMDIVVITEVDAFFGENGQLSEGFVGNLSILATVFNAEERANQLATSIDTIVSDILSIVDGKTSKYENVYIGSASQAGAKVLTWTVGSYCPFDLVGLNNSFTGSTSTVAVDGGSEVMSACNPDVIFVDLSGTAQYAKDGSIPVLTYAEMKDVPVFALLPYFWFGLNFDNALADAYLLTYYAYGTSYSACIEKIEAVYEAFYPEMEDGSAALDGFYNYYSNTGSKVFIGNEYGVEDGAITFVSEPVEPEPGPVSPGVIEKIVETILAFIQYIISIIRNIFGFII